MKRLWIALALVMALAPAWALAETEPVEILTALPAPDAGALEHASDGVRFAWWPGLDEGLSDNELYALIYATGSFSVSATHKQLTPEPQVRRLVSAARRIEADHGWRPALYVRQHVYNDWHWSTGPGNPAKYDPLYAEQGLLNKLQNLAIIRGRLALCGWTDFDGVTLLLNYERWRVAGEDADAVRRLLRSADRLYRMQPLFPGAELVAYAQQSKPFAGRFNVYLPEPLLGRHVNQECYFADSPALTFGHLATSARYAQEQERPFSVTVSIDHAWGWKVYGDEGNTWFNADGADFAPATIDPALLWLYGSWLGGDDSSHFPAPAQRPELVVFYPTPSLEALRPFALGACQLPLDWQPKPESVELPEPPTAPKPSNPAEPAE